MIRSLNTSVLKQSTIFGQKINEYSKFGHSLNITDINIQKDKMLYGPLLDGMYIFKLLDTLYICVKKIKGISCWRMTCIFQYIPYIGGSRVSWYRDKMASS